VSSEFAEALAASVLGEAKSEIRMLEGALDILSNPFRGSRRLTARERSVLAQLVRGATGKEAGRALGHQPSHCGISPREYLEKARRAKNLVDLVRKVASGIG
jgi:hypothetical protein